METYLPSFWDLTNSICILVEHVSNCWFCTMVKNLSCPQRETVSCRFFSNFRIHWRREPRTHWKESRMLLSWVKRRNREKQEATSLQPSCPSTTSRGSKWPFHWKRAQLLSRQSAREMCRWVSRLFIPGSGNLDVRDAHLMSRMLSALRPDWPLKRSVSFI